MLKNQSIYNINVTTGVNATQSCEAFKNYATPDEKAIADTVGQI